MWKLIGGIFVGWGLGSNDSANIFGTGVAANVIKYRTAIILISIFVVVGALLEGHKSFHTVGDMSKLSHMAAFNAAFAAGLCVAAFSYFSLPVSTSQAIMGAVLGIGMISGIPHLERLYKVIICWVLTPVVAMVCSFVLYPLLGKAFQKALMGMHLRSRFIRSALLFAGCYGAYSLGANNVANVTGVYVGSGLLTPFQASLIGSLSIVLGVLTYSRKVMHTVGKKIVELDGFSAFVSEFSAAITVHLSTQLGVPVSSSQAIVGGVTGVGLLKGVRSVSKRTLIEIAAGWVTTPLASGIAAYMMMKVYLVFSGTGL
ncbi:MAG: inorganic phosphate transporter [Deltaproteobacteria bacterium]|nr:inorganic phosphate transporter [Deltaproteobacteria bacterium]